MDEVLDFLKKTQTYYIATVEGDQPRVRPFGTIHKFEDKLYIQTGRSKDVSKQIAANPKVEICAFADGDWLRVECTLVDDNRIEAEKSLMDDYEELKSMYQPGDGNTQVLYLKDATASFYSFTAPPRIVKF